MSPSRKGSRRGSANVRGYLLSYISLKFTASSILSFIVVADYRKNSDVLGTTVKRTGLPALREVTSFFLTVQAGLPYRSRAVRVRQTFTKCPPPRLPNGDPSNG